MIRAIGIDPSCSATGLALADGTCRTIRPRSTGPRRLHEIVTELTRQLVLPMTGGVEVAVIEVPAMHGPGSIARMRLAEAGAVIKLRLFELEVPYVEVNNSTLKAYGAHTGRAKKEQMVAAAREAGAVVADDNQADAWLLRSMALDHYSGRYAAAAQKGPIYQQRREILACIEWPLALPHHAACPDGQRWKQ